jgi:hypothetical protein
MHYFQIEFEAHNRQEELLREARERRLARALKSRRCNDSVLEQLRVRRLLGLLWHESRYEAGCAIVEEDGEVLPRPTERTKATGTA